jgi:hypothetical protein
LLATTFDAALASPCASRSSADLSNTHRGGLRRAQHQRCARFRFCFRRGWKEGRDPSAGFDTLGYLGANPDVAAAGVNPLEHYLTFGIYEERQAVSDGLWH